MKVNTGIDEQQREKIAKGLSRLLANTYTLYLKTHNFHWNVTGPMFYPLHKMFEEQYQGLAESVDEIAERIRALGFHAPGSYAEFAKLKTIDEEHGIPTSMRMIEILMTDHETCARTAREIFPIADDAKDEPSADLLTQRMTHHEKTAWMLRSTLEPAK